MNHNKKNIFLFLLPAVFIMLCLVQACIKNDLPYPKIQQNITALAAVGQSRDASIDSAEMKATVYLEETTDIENVSFSTFGLTPGATSDVNLLEGSYNLSSPLQVIVYELVVAEYRNRECTHIIVVHSHTGNTLAGNGEGQ